MNNSKIELSTPHMGGNEQKFVNEAFESNWVAPLGPNIIGFEKDLETFIGNNTHVAALSSGTAAIHLGLILLNVNAGDEVLCQSFTFSATANPILYQGAIPVFIDSEPETWNVCPIALENAIIDRIKNHKKPKAIIAVHLYGMPFKVDEVLAISKKYDIPVLEDSAEALGSKYKGLNCGSFGDIATLSFNGNKIITTSGGGALVSKDSYIKEKAVFLATQAKDKAPHYEHSEIGYNYRLSNICAGIGRGQMQVLTERVNSRREIHDFYVNYFNKIDGVSVFCEPNADYFSNYWLTTIVLDSNKLNGKTAENLRLALEKENIESRPLWKPMHLQPIFKKYLFFGSDVCENLFKTGLCLPSGSNLTENEKERITVVFDSFFNF